MFPLKKSVESFIRNHRRSKPIARMARACEAYLWSFYNQDYFDFDRNGEAFVMDRINQWRTGLTVWDVGAHNGEWAAAADERLSGSHITSFEILPEIFERLGLNTKHAALNYGLSDHEGSVSVAWSKHFETSSSINPRTGSQFFAKDVTMVDCRVARGDWIIEQGLAPPPEFLKVDTEGHEVPVLRGLLDLLSSNKAPAVIQLEYGETYLPGGFTLKNVYDLLSPLGYEIGRVYPDHVDFQPYHYRLDHFRMGNLVAVKDQDLQAALR